MLISYLQFNNWSLLRIFNSNITPLSFKIQSLIYASSSIHLKSDRWDFAKKLSICIKESLILSFDI